jgi:hypothetical protein
VGAGGRGRARARAARAAAAAASCSSSRPFLSRAHLPPSPAPASAGAARQWGTVRDVMILRDRATGLSRGCAFVGYETSEEAEAAIQNLDRRVHLPGALGPLEVGGGAGGAG